MRCSNPHTYLCCQLNLSKNNGKMYASGERMAAWGERGGWGGGASFLSACVTLVDSPTVYFWHARCHLSQAFPPLLLHRVYVWC